MATLEAAKMAALLPKKLAMRAGNPVAARQHLRMQTEIFTLCDAATVAGGKLNILGSFDTIGALTFPCDHPLCVVACKMRFDLGEEGMHLLEIHFCDPDMRPVMQPMKRELDVQIGNQMSQAHVHLWQHMGFHLERPGEYYFELKMDGKTQSRIPLYVIQVEQQGEGEPQ